MRKQIKRYGGSFVITLSPEEMKVYNLKEKDIIDFELKKMVLIQDGNSNPDHIKNTTN